MHRLTDRFMRNDDFASAVNEEVAKKSAISRKDGKTKDLDKQSLHQRRIKKGGEPTRNIIAEIPHPSGVPNYRPPSHFGTEDRFGAGWSRSPCRSLFIML